MSKMSDMDLVRREAIRLVPNCMMHPTPKDDPVGQALSSLNMVVPEIARLSEQDPYPQELIDDRHMVASAIQMLKLVLLRTECEMATRHMDAAE